MSAGNRIRVAVLSVLGLIWLAPVYLILVNAAKDQATYTSTSAWMPAGLSGLVENLGIAWTRGNLGEGIAATATYAIIAPVVSVLIGAAAGYAIVALRLRRGSFWLIVIFTASVFPLQMLLSPLFVGYVEVGLYDTRIGMILVYTVVNLSFSAFVMRNFFTGIAHNVFEAAVLDGASTWRIFARVYLPMASSALVAVFILQATFIWNDLLLGLVLSQSDSVRPIVTSLAGMQSTYGGAQMSVVLAGGLLVSLPTVVLFLFTQKFFARGLALGQY